MTTPIRPLPNLRDLLDVAKSGDTWLTTNGDRVVLHSVGPHLILGDVDSGPGLTLTGQWTTWGASLYPYIVDLAGPEVLLAAPAPTWGPPTSRVCNSHDWIDTGGLMRSYCRFCDAVGVWDRSSLSYVERFGGV